MKVITPLHQEIAFRNCHDLLKTNPLALQNYYSTLFITFKALLTVEDIFRLNKMIKDLEDYISDDLNPLTLREAEVRMYNSNDLLAGFMVRGIIITQLDIQEKLEDIKLWLTEKLFEYMPNIRFTMPIQVE